MCTVDLRQTTQGIGSKQASKRMCTWSVSVKQFSSEVSTHTHTHAHTHTRAHMQTKVITFNITYGTHRIHDCLPLFQEALENRANAAQDEQSLQDTPDSKDGLQAVLLTDVEDSPDDSQASRPDMDGQLVRGQGVKRPSPGGQQGVQSQSAAAGQGVQTQSAGVQVHVAPAVLEQDDDERGVNGKRRKGDVCGKSFLDTLNDCLHDYTGREDRRKVETDRENTPNVLWAKNLALQIEEVRDEKKRKLLKLKITQMVNNCQMDELQNE